MAKNRITIVLPDLEVGGAQRIMLFIAREFIERDINVDLILLSSSDSLMDTIPEEVNVIKFSDRNSIFGQFGLIISSIIKLVFWIRREKPDVIFSTITGANLVTLLSARLSGVSSRVVIREAVTLRNSKSGSRIHAMKWLYPKADAVIALTQYMANEMNEVIGVPLSRIKCISNPVDTAYIKERSNIPVQHEWFGDDTIKVIISVGRMIVQKDFETLLRAFALLPKNLNARLIVVGDGPERIVLEELALDIDIADNIYFPGFDSNPWRWMSRANLFVLSSSWEGNPNVLLEALALDLPVISTEYDVSVHELAKQYGFRVTPAGVERELAKAIEEELTSNRTYKYRIRNDAKNVVQRYLSSLGITSASDT